MSRFLSVLTVLALLLSSFPAVHAEANQEVVQVVQDGRELSFDVPPMVRDGRTLVPLRAIFEALGATVGYEPATQTITATRDTTVIVLRVGESRAQVNEKPVMLDVPSQVVDGRTLVPLRFVSEALGAQVGWDGATRTVSITSAYTLTIQPPQGEGSTDPQPGARVLARGTSFYLRATPAPGWRFSHWIVDGRIGPDRSTLAGAMERDRAVQPVFERITHTLRILPPQGEGTVDPESGNYELPEGTRQKVTASPAPNWRFSHWLVDGKMGPDTPVLEGIVERDQTVRPVFEEILYTLTMLKPQGEGTAEPAPGTHTGKAGSQMTVTATPAPGWRFSHWVVDESIGSDAPTMSLTLQDDQTMWPVFERLWGSMAGGIGVDADITADAFRVFIAADAAAESDNEPFGATFHGLRPLRGNFDIQVPFELAEWPQENGVRVFLGAAGFQVERTSFGSRDDFPGYPRNVYLVGFQGVHAITATDDTSGKLRIRRQGDKLTGYYGAGDRWIPLHTADVSADDVQIRLGAFSNDALFSGQAVRVNFDIPEWPGDSEEE